MPFISDFLTVFQMKISRKMKCRLAGFLTVVLFIVFLKSSANFMSQFTPYADSDKRCTERKRVAFVKVHKAASTTITTILQRFGFTRNLTFALPRQDIHHIGLFKTFHPKNVMPISDGSVYDIVCQHVVFNKEAFRQYLPADTTIIAAVRDPAEIFMSAFLAFPEYGKSVKAHSQIQKRDTLSLMGEYLNDPGFYDPPHFKVGALVLNRMSFDFGLPKEQYTNKEYVMEYIKMLDDSMTLVLVADRFDVSLVILKRKLCWSTKDILYKIQHKGGRKKPQLPVEVQKKIKELSPSDYQLYEHFRNKLNKIALQEINLSDEVNVFQETLKNVSLFCKTKPKQGRILHVNTTTFSEGFTFGKHDCELLGFRERDFVIKLIKHQVPKDQHSLFHGW